MCCLRIWGDSWRSMRTRRWSSGRRGSRGVELVIVWDVELNFLKLSCESASSLQAYAVP